MDMDLQTNANTLIQEVLDGTTLLNNSRKDEKTLTENEMENIQNHINNLVTLSYFTIGEFSGFKGHIQPDMIVNLWYYYRWVNSVNLDKYPLSSDIQEMIKDFKLDEFHEDVYEQLKPSFRKLVSQKGIVNVLMIHLNDDEISKYMELIKKLHGTDNIQVQAHEDMTFTQVQDYKSNMSVAEIINVMKSFTTQYQLICCPRDQEYVLLEPDDCDETEVQKKTITLLGVSTFVLEDS